MSIDEQEDQRVSGTPEQTMKTMKILWSALLLSHFLLIFTTYFSHSTVGFYPNQMLPDFSNQITFFLTVIAVFQLGTSIILPKIIIGQLRHKAAQSKNRAAVYQYALSPLIMTWALRESITLLGFVSSFITHDPNKISCICT